MWKKNSTNPTLLPQGQEKKTKQDTAFYQSEYLCTLWLTKAPFNKFFFPWMAHKLQWQKEKKKIKIT